MIDLGTLPGDTGSAAYGINNLGQIVGTSDTATGVQHIFLYSNGRMRNVGDFGDFSPVAINNHGQIIGSKIFAVPPPESFYYLSYLYTGGPLRDLGLLPTFQSTRAASINDSGEIVGTCSSTTPENNKSVGFFWNGVIHQITVPGWTIITANGINDSGQIAAMGTRPVGTLTEEHALVLTPTR
jgi:probable HAF family extracellular repeat protein